MTTTELWVNQELGVHTPYDTHNTIGWWVLLAGILLRMSAWWGFPTLTIIHEFFHVIAAEMTGGNAVSVTLIKTSFYSDNPRFVWLAGYYGELLIGGGLAICMPFRHIGKLGYGLMFVSIFEAPHSTDFAKAGADVNLFVFLWVAVFLASTYALVARGNRLYQVPTKGDLRVYLQKARPTGDMLPGERLVRSKLRELNRPREIVLRRPLF